MFKVYKGKASKLIWKKNYYLLKCTYNLCIHDTDSLPAFIFLCFFPGFYLVSFFSEMEIQENKRPSPRKSKQLKQSFILTFKKWFFLWMSTCAWICVKLDFITKQETQFIRMKCRYVNILLVILNNCFWNKTIV